MKKDAGGPSTILGAIAMESLLSSAEQSPAAPASPISSPVTARRTINELGDQSQSPQSPSMATVRIAKLNLIEEKLKDEFKGNSRLST